MSKGSGLGLSVRDSSSYPMAILASSIWKQLSQGKMLMQKYTTLERQKIGILLAVKSAYIPKAAN
jgi:hypothetical protein